MSRAEQIARAAFKVGAVEFSVDPPFRWASGYFMPMYNDNRRLLWEPEARSIIREGFVELLKDRGLKPEVVAGVATAGIPHGVLLAEALSLPFTYVRAKAKGHGRGNQIEGLPGPAGYEGRSVIVVEDVISTGRSVLQAIEAIKEAGGKVSGCLSIFNYGFSATLEQFLNQDPPVDLLPICAWENLIKTAKEIGFIENEMESHLRQWRNDPFGWGEKMGFPPEQSD
jgi:orotate phosphoribosyltransferase